MNGETDIHNRILVALSRAYHPHGIFWRQNAGRIRSDRGAWVSLGPTGISDVVGVVYGMPVFVEVKTATGKQRKCQSARKTDPLSASKIDPPCDVEIRA